MVFMRRSPLCALLFLLFFVFDPVESFYNRQGQQHQHRLFPQFQRQRRRSHFAFGGSGGGPIVSRQNKKFLGHALLGYVGTKVVSRCNSKILTAAAILWVASEIMSDVGPVEFVLGYEIFGSNAWESIRKGKFKFIREVHRPVPTMLRTMGTGNTVQLEKLREAYQADPSGPLGKALGALFHIDEAVSTFLDGDNVREMQQQQQTMRGACGLDASKLMGFTSGVIIGCLT